MVVGAISPWLVTAATRGVDLVLLWSFGLMFLQCC